MPDISNLLSNWSESVQLDEDAVDELSVEEIDEWIIEIQQKIDSLDKKLSKTHENYKSYLKEGAESDGIRRQKAVYNAQIAKERFELHSQRYQRYLNIYLLLNRIKILREIRREDEETKVGDILDTSVSLSEIDETKLLKLTVDQNDFDFPSSGEHESEDNGIPVEPILEDVSTVSSGVPPGTVTTAKTIDAFGRSSDADPTVSEELSPTPHTLWELPKNDTLAYFYYFTDETYSNDGSKFKRLDDCLTILGRHRSGLEVVIIDRDRLTPITWDAITDGLSLEDYPALVIAEEPLGIEDVHIGATEFDPNKVDYATIEDGIISDHILQDDDEIRNFLNELYDASLNNDIESSMKREKISKYLSIAKDEVKSLIHSFND